MVPYAFNLGWGNKTTPEKDNARFVLNSILLNKEFPITPGMIDSANGFDGMWENISTTEGGFETTDGSTMFQFHCPKSGEYLYYVPEADSWILYSYKTASWEVRRDHMVFMNNIERELAEDLFGIDGDLNSVQEPASPKAEERLKMLIKAIRYAECHPYVRVTIDQLRTLHDISKWFYLHHLKYTKHPDAKK